MLVTSKLLAAAFATAAVGTLGTVAWLNISGAPHYRDLSTDSDFDTTDKKLYHNKFSTDYAKYFVGVSPKSKDTNIQIDNTKWWEWSFNYRYLKAKPEDIKTKFKSKTTFTQLKETCKEAYQANPDQVTNNATDDKYEESNIWTFCSIGGNKPKSIEEADVQYGEPNSYIKDSIARKYLIATNNYENNWFWKIKEKEFFNTDLNAFSEESYFKLERSKYLSFYKMPSLKRTCLSAYHSDKTKDSTKFPKTEIYKFCSLTGKTPN